jgi:anti-sigma factor RsiW
MACEQWGAKLDRYLDGELDPAESAGLAVHLRGCAGCAADVLQRVLIKRSVQMAGKRYTPSAELRHRITEKIAAKSRGGAARQWRLVLAPALAVLVAAVFLNSYFAHERGARETVYSELADLHVGALASSTPVDVVSSDRHTVKPWFQGRIPFSFNLPELAGTEFSLLGGRVAYLEQTPGAHLIYQIRKHEISVFIFLDRNGAIPSLPDRPANAGSFHTESWTQNGLRYFVVGDANAADIQALSKLLRNAG